MENELTQLANKYLTDKGTIYPEYHGYTNVYYEIWKDLKEEAKNVFEIGIGSECARTKEASSHKMLRDFFVNANIYGIDVSVNFNLNENRIFQYKCDQTDKSKLKDILDKLELMDIIIDDGGHNTIYQQISFGFLFQYVKSGGIYIIEDLHTSVWGGWGLPASHPNCALSVLKRFQETGIIDTPYMTDEEKDYLNNNILSIDIIDIKGTNNDITSIIKKK